MPSEVELQYEGKNVSATNPLPVAASISLANVAEESGGNLDRIAAALAGTLTVTGSISVDTTGLATSAKQDTGNTSLASILAALGQPLSVTGNFYQPTQPVSGTFFQPTQPVSLASVPTHAVTQSGAWSVSVSNFPASFGAVQSGVWSVSISNWPATQPVSAASLPLPSGAATAVGITALTAKTPALGTAGSASADVISVQGIASMTPLKVDGSGVTQPVVGTVTANAGTNMSTASLALEAGGNLAALVSQGANDLPANRTLVTLSALLATGATSEALLTLIANKGGVNQSGATSYTVTAGKTLRLTGLHVDVLNTTTVANRVQVNVRAVNGTVGAGSPIVGRLMAASQAALAASGGSDDISFPEGVCIPAGWQVGISQICSVTTAAIVSVVLTGYEY